MDRNYIPLEKRLSCEEDDSDKTGYVSFEDLNTDNLLGEMKPKIRTSPEMSKKVKRILSKPLRKFTSALQKPKSREEPIVAFGHCAMTGVSMCAVNAAFS